MGHTAETFKALGVGDGGDQLNPRAAEKERRVLPALNPYGTGG